MFFQKGNNQLRNTFARSKKMLYSHVMTEKNWVIRITELSDVEEMFPFCDLSDIITFGTVK